MGKRRHNRRTPLVALFLLVALALVLGGMFQATTDKAAALGLYA